MASAVERLLETARKEIGYLEKSKTEYEKDPTILDDPIRGAGSDNYTKYARDQWKERYFNGQKQGVSWCAVFVGWCFFRTFGKKTALALQCQPSSGNAGAGCGAASNYYKNRGRWRETPEPGDQIFFTDGIQMTHTGIVESVTGGKVCTIEGNSDGGVRKHKYDLYSARIAGYGHPDWSIAGDADRDEDRDEDEGEDRKMNKPATVVLPTGCSGSTVFLRSQKSTKSEYIARIKVGTQVTVIEDAGDWCRIQADGHTGWMMSNFIEYTDQEDESSDDGSVVIKPEQTEAIETALTTLEQLRDQLTMTINVAVDTIGGIVGRG